MTSTTDRGSDLCQEKLGVVTPKILLKAGGKESAPKKKGELLAFCFLLLTTAMTFTQAAALAIGQDRGEIRIAYEGATMAQVIPVTGKTINKPQHDNVSELHVKIKRSPVAPAPTVIESLQGQPAEQPGGTTSPQSEPQNPG